MLQTHKRIPRLLSNPHLQSALATCALSMWTQPGLRWSLESGSNAHVLDCGHGVRLEGLHTPQRRPEGSRGLIVILHGWLGSAQSVYVARAAARLVAQGFEVFRLNFRDHGDTHTLNSGPFHCCCLNEVAGAIRAIVRKYRPARLGILGFSLGGNFALRLARRAASERIPIACVVAVCPVLNGASSLEAVERAPRAYSEYFLGYWRESLNRKRAAFPGENIFSDREMKLGLRSLLDLLARRHAGRASLNDYFDAYAIHSNTLEKVDIRTHLLVSADDPVIPPEGFNSLKLSEQVALDLVPAGGHCGFVHSWTLRSWMDDYVVARFNAAMDRTWSATTDGSDEIVAETLAERGRRFAALREFVT